MLFGAAGGVLVVFSILGLDKLKIDDPVGAISVHGVVGLLGLLLVPFHQRWINFLRSVSARPILLLLL
jgi:Amt family ammonium transporter